MTGTTISLKPSEMTVEELVQVSQGLGHQIEKLRGQRAQLKELIANKLREQRVNDLKAQMAALQDQIDAEAPGAVIEARASAV